MKINISNTISSFEAKAHFSQLLQRVKAGERITILRHNFPIAVLTPILDNKESDIQCIIENIISFSNGKNLNDISLKSLIDEGKR